MFDFNKVFKDDSWKNESVIDKCPCNKCKEKRLLENPYYETEKCKHCVDYAVWIPNVIRKLAYLEKEANLNWIPVEDHLPKIDEVVIVQDVLGNIYMGKLYDPERDRKSVV